MNNILVDENGYAEFNNLLLKYQKESQNTSSLASNANDDDPNSWHDNFAFEESVRQSKLVSAKIAKMLQDKPNLKIVKPHISGDEYINIGDTFDAEFVYADGMHEKETLILTGNYLPHNDKDITEITLNSIVGSKVFKCKVPSTITYLANEKEIKIHILQKR